MYVYVCVFVGRSFLHSTTTPDITTNTPVPALHHNTRHYNKHTCSCTPPQHQTLQQTHLFLHRQRVGPDAEDFVDLSRHQKSQGVKT